MKAKILGLLAVALLTGPMAANAGYLYTFSNSQSTPTASVSFESANFVTTTGLIPFAPQTTGGITFAAAGLTVCNGSAYFLFASQSVAPGGCSFTLVGQSFYSGFSFVPLTTGDFNAISSVGSLEMRYLRITETSFVPEPGTLALLGFGLAGLGVSRRRKTA